MTDRRKPGGKFWTAVGLFVAIAVYVGAYACMVEDTTVGWGRTARVVAEYYDPFTGFSGEPIWDAVFAPVYWADRRIRREKWTPR